MKIDTKEDALRAIKAIPTRYDGVLFRSRNEARWAVFFRYLGIVYQYEPEGFITDGAAYLPDFLLASQSLIAEVKPSFDADPDGVQKLRNLISARGRERGVILPAIQAGEMNVVLIGPEILGETWEEDHASWLSCPNGYHYAVQPYPQIGCSECRHDGDYWYESDRIKEAYEFARSYRFDKR